MRVLLLHNRYRSLGGEERAVADIAQLLASRGHTVELLERASADAGRARAAGALLAGGIDPGSVAQAVRRMGAEVVHAHNVHPLFGWRALAAARAGGARTVLHLHNFRLFCAIGVAYRNGAPCFRCRGRDTMPGVRLRCRGSLGEAVVYAAGLARQQARLIEHSDRIVAVSLAQATRLHELGLPSDRTRVLPNFVWNSGLAARPGVGAGYALVAGRLVEEKGYDTAIRAARAAEVPLVIAGAGPDEQRLRRLAEGADVRLVGWVAPDRLAELRRDAAVLLAPSRWEEPCPYAVLDALAAGVPVLASNRGGLPELVGEEAALDPDDVSVWTSALLALRDEPARREQLGAQALTRARELFGEDRYYEALLQVYAPG